jgi:hypothetical protein
MAPGHDVGMGALRGRKVARLPRQSCHERVGEPILWQGGANAGDERARILRRQRLRGIRRHHGLVGLLVIGSRLTGLGL